MRELYKKIKGNVKKIIESNKSLHILTSKGYYILNISANNQTLDSVAIPKNKETKQIHIDPKKLNKYLIFSNIFSLSSSFNCLIASIR